MKPSTIQLLKENPEAFKEVAIDYGMYYCTHESFKDEKVWNSFLSEALRPDWEILEIKATKEHLVDSFSIMNGEYLGHHGDDCTILNHSEVIQEVACGNYTIHSVRRSDGEVFTVGDRTQSHGAIQGFQINEQNEMACLFDNGRRAFIRHITKLKPIFKTEDGVQIYDGDKTFMVDFEHEILGPMMYSGENSSHKYFSTRSAAEQWVEDHRPTVSIAQIREFAEKDLPFQTVEALLLHLKSKK